MSDVLETNCVRAGRLLALAAPAYRRLLRRAPAEGIAGGRTYDAVIAECLLKARPATLPTFNAPHSLAFSGRGLEIVVPGESDAR